MSPISLNVSPPCFLTQSLREPKLTDDLGGSLVLWKPCLPCSAVAEITTAGNHPHLGI